ncbi:MAG: Smr/MutS family protein [Candidatus Lokiarchaeota archaeon]|nr:Smr/MutS family protein [Candidatus Lokiarchaeota archaeon]
MEAIDEILYRLEECHEKGEKTIILIHGYHGKHILKSYIESEGFLRDIKRGGFKLKRKSNSNPGQSIFDII